MWEFLHNLFNSILVLAVSGGLCILMQRLFPATLNQKIFRKGLRLDFAYWLFTHIITIKVITFSAVFVLTLISLVNPKTMAMIDATTSEHVTGLNVIFALILLDFCGYWIHRLTHHERLWKFHAIHHSSAEIDWLSSTRFHPLESIAVVVIGFNICILAGFGIQTIGAAIGLRGLYGYIVHANLTWNYGPLGYIIASPYFHRWHHAKDKAALDKNFAGVFSLWDFIFGTAYMPKKLQPQNFGISQDIGNNLWQHITYPFRQSPDIGKQPPASL